MNHPFCEMLQSREGWMTGILIYRFYTAPGTPCHLRFNTCFGIRLLQCHAEEGLHGSCPSFFPQYFMNAMLEGLFQQTITLFPEYPSSGDRSWFSFSRKAPAHDDAFITWKVKSPVNPYDFSDLMTTSCFLPADEHGKVALPRLPGISLYRGICQT